MADIKHALVADGDPLVTDTDWNAAHTIEDGSVAFAKLVGAAAASHSHSGADITSGTVADARIDAAIARDSEITSAIGTHEAAGDPHPGYTTAAELAATKLDDLATPDDNTDLNATTGRHGLLPKLGGGTTNFLRADGAWDSPSGTGSVATDPIWDAAGDLAVGTGANTAARLALGNPGGALSRINGAVAWNSGTANPGSAAAGDRFWRTDLGLEVYFDGTRWLTTTLYNLAIPFSLEVGSPLTTTAGAVWRASVWNGVYDLWLVDFYAMTFVSTTNNGTNFWTVTLNKETKAAGYAISAVASFSTGTGPDTASQFIAHTVAIGALLGTGYGTVNVAVAKTLSPGSLTAAVGMTYRLVIP